jgi:hypothetical protein
MNLYLESFLRSLGVFLSVYFTVGWGGKSKLVYDEYVMVAAVLAALAGNYMVRRG